MTRRISRRATVPTGLAVALVASASVVGGLALATADDGTSPAAGVPRACQALPPAVPARTRVRQLVPDGPRGVRLCRLGPTTPVEAGATPSAPLAGRSASGGTAVRLARLLDRLQPLRGTRSCPADDGSEVVLVFRYANGHETRVDLGLTGCLVAARGSVRRTALLAPGKTLRAEIRALVG